MGIWKLKRRCPSAVVYNSDTDGYQPRFGCNVWRCRCPDKRNLSREISQRNLSCHDNSLHRLLPPSPLLSSSLLTLLLRLRLRLPIRILSLRLPIPTLLRVSIPTLVVVTQNKSARQKGGRFCRGGGSPVPPNTVTVCCACHRHLVCLSAPFNVATHSPEVGWLSLYLLLRFLVLAKSFPDNFATPRPP